MLVGSMTRLIAAPRNLVRSSSKCSVIGASVAILARRSKQANLHDSSMQTNAARSRRNPPGRYKFAMTALSSPFWRTIRESSPFGREQKVPHHAS